MRVSVVVPFHNAQRNLHDCLQALVEQDSFDGDYEIAAVDDRSSDDSAAVVHRFPEVRLLASDAPGPYAARNVGIAATSGDVVAFTDGDCEPARDWLRQIVQAFDQSETGVLVGPRIPARDTFGLVLVCAYERAKDEYVFGGRRTDLYYASANNMAVRRNVLSVVGPFEERRRGADTLYVRRVAQALSPEAVRYVPQLRVRHLEVDGLRAYYRKLLAYGRSMRRLDRATGRVLGSRERLAIWRMAVRREGLSAPRAVAMFAALSGGGLCWILGTVSGLVPRQSRA